MIKQVHYRKRPVSNEHNHQVALFRWAQFNALKHPELAALYAIPNAGKRNRKYDPVKQKWYSIEGGRLKAEGMKKGMPDICLPVKRGTYGALYIEMKDIGKKPDKDQLDCHELLRSMGNLVHVCYSWDDAVGQILAYLNLPALEPIQINTEKRSFIGFCMVCRQNIFTGDKHECKVV